jgi:hypothetical protein
MKTGRRGELRLRISPWMTSGPMGSDTDVTELLARPSTAMDGFARQVASHDVKTVEGKLRAM